MSPSSVGQGIAFRAHLLSYQGVRVLLWNVLCPGPSLGKLRVESLAPGPVVAVNLAIHVHAVLPVTIWSSMEPAWKWAEAWARIPKPARGEIFVWCRQRESHDWRAVGFRTSPHPDSEADFRAQVLGRGFKHDVHYTSLSILTTLARVVMAGATAIHLYGCDMAGAGYFAGKDPDDKTSLVWKARWKDERRQFLAFEKEFGSVCPITRK